MCILFPELEKLVPTLHMASVYALLSEFPGANAVATAHLTRLSNLLSESSKGRYGKDTAVMFREAARSSIGSRMPAKSLELKHTIKLIQELTVEIDEIETAIKRIMDESMSAIGMNPSELILRRNARKESIIMLHYLMPQKTCTADFRNGKIRTGIHISVLTYSVNISF